MRKLVVLACLCLLPVLMGCSLLPDALFGVFGSAYSGGGDTRADRQEHFERQVDLSQSQIPE